MENFKHGDILIAKDFNFYFYFDKIDEKKPDCFKRIGIGYSSIPLNQVRHITDDERKEYDRLLRIDNTMYDYDKIVRFKPKINEKYNCIYAENPLKFTIKERIWKDSDIDNKYYKSNNCYALEYDINKKIEKYEGILHDRTKWNFA
jgi:hypothetical protein